MKPTIDVTWSLREPPLAPRAAAVCGTALARAMTKKLLKWEDTKLRNLQCVASSDVLFVLAEESDLPWLDGVVFIGQERHSTVYLPTVLQPCVPLPLLERAILVANPSLMAPIAVLPSASIVLSLAKPFIPDRKKLQSILEQL